MTFKRKCFCRCPDGRSQGGPAAPRAAGSVKLGLGLGELCEMIGFLLPESSPRKSAKGAKVGGRSFVTEATERGHRGSRRRTADRQGGPAAPRAADRRGDALSRARSARPTPEKAFRGPHAVVRRLPSDSCAFCAASPPSVPFASAPDLRRAHDKSEPAASVLRLGEPD